MSSSMPVLVSPKVLVKDDVIRFANDETTEVSYVQSEENYYSMHHLPRMLVLGMFDALNNNKTHDAMVSNRVRYFSNRWKNIINDDHAISFNSSELIMSDVLSCCKNCNVDHQLVKPRLFLLLTKLIKLNKILSIDCNSEMIDTVHEIQSDIISEDTVCVIRTSYINLNEIYVRSSILFHEAKKKIPTMEYVVLVDTTSGCVYRFTGESIVGRNIQQHIDALKDVRRLMGSVSNSSFEHVGMNMKGGLGSLLSFTNSMNDLMTSQNKMIDFQPKQIFLGNPRSKEVNSSEKSIEKKKQAYSAFLSYHSLLTTAIKNRIFVHGTYAINLCDRSHSIKRHIDDLVTCSMFGFGGLVIHVGKNTLKVSNSEALEAMKLTLTRIIKTSCERVKSCSNQQYIAPLLLETAAGQGTETLTSLNEMVMFCKEMLALFPGQFGVCIDTCHVFALGYSPIYYLTRMYSEIGNSIKLVHLNDSKKRLGCRVDRHDVIGRGCIDVKDLAAVADFCHQNGIAVLSEPPSS